MQVGEIFVALGFQTDSASLNQFDDGIKSLSRNILALVGVSSLSLYGLKQIVDSAVEGAAAFQQFTTQTGLSQKALQQWQSVAVQTSLNLKPEAVQSGIMAFQKQLTQMQVFGTGDAQAFNALGISPLRSALENLDAIRQNIGQYSKPVQASLLERIGLSGDWIPVLELAADKFNTFKTSFVLTDAQIAQTQKAGIAIQVLGRSIAFAKDKFVGDNADSIVKIVKVLGDTIAFVGESFGALMRGFDRIGWLKYAFAGIVAGLVTIWSPLVAITAAVGIFGKALADLLFSDDYENSPLARFFMFLGGIVERIGETLFKMKNFAGSFFSGELGRSLPNPTTGISFNDERAAAQSKTIVYNNTFNVQSNGDPLAVSESVFNTFKNAVNQRNNGALN